MATLCKKGAAPLTDIDVTEVRWGVSIEVFRGKSFWNCKVLTGYLEIAVEIVKIPWK